MLSAMAYPMTFLVQQSRTVARYTNPTHVRMYVMSPTHLSPGARAAGVPAHEVGAGVDVVGAVRWCGSSGAVARLSAPSRA